MRINQKLVFNNQFLVLNTWCVYIFLPPGAIMSWNKWVTSQVRILQKINLLQCCEGGGGWCNITNGDHNKILLSLYWFKACDVYDSHTLQQSKANLKNLMNGRATTADCLYKLMQSTCNTVEFLGCTWQKTKIKNSTAFWDFMFIRYKKF